MTSKPLYFPPAPFDLGDALTCSNLVDIAYAMYAQWLQQGKPHDPHCFRWQPPAGAGFRFGAPVWGNSQVLAFHDLEPFALVAQRGSDAYAIFRGTESPEDWYVDARCEQVPYQLPNVTDAGYVHKGFVDLYQSLRLAVLDQLASLAGVRRLLLTGHSLGASLAMVGMPDLMANAALPAVSFLQYNLAGPRTGDAAFASLLNSGPANIYRIVNSCDLVPDVPPSVFDDLTCHVLYQHVGDAITFTAQYNSVVGNHDHHASYNYALAHPEQPQGPVPS
ncbi:lipase family protein [Accumulibacter sp.]|uniref:lipase family protein n=1 Tax=Accumulibacter sp. TaxID=2053492 RepID=UPI0026198403|nr:lipase family protein [Accumulibacter sp.]